MKYPLYVVTGAPGSGKSTALEAFLILRRDALHSDYIAFDIDWLADTASSLAGKDIYTDPSTWKPYGMLWFEVLHAINRNGQTPLFFTPNDPEDFRRFGQPAWCSTVEWLLLDCDDHTRRERLAQRLDWTEAMIAEALTDARVLRQTVPFHVDTGLLSPGEVAVRIVDWLEQLHKEGEFEL